MTPTKKWAVRMGSPKNKSGQTFFQTEALARRCAIGWGGHLIEMLDDKPARELPLDKGC